MSYFSRNKDFSWKLAAALVLFLVNVLNIANPLLEQHSFRQTQTAISVFYLIKDGFILDYITPVLGRGYAIPFEFPIFHFIVAFLSKYLFIPLDISGLLTSLLFAIGALAVNDLLLKEIGVDKRARLFAFLLICCSPVFLFWSGTFMIESAALFLCLASFLYAAKYLKFQNNIYLLLWFCCATLALLQKVTTGLFPYLFCCSGIVNLFYTGKKNSLLSRVFILLFVACPIIIAYAWVIHTDALKSANPVALVKLTSSALSGWNYGTLEQRLSASFWLNNLYQRGLAPSALMGLGFLLTILVVFFSSMQRRLKLIVSAFIFLYFLPQLTFANLFVVHNYYHYAVIIYLCNAIAISYFYIGCSHERIIKYLVVISCICSLVYFSKDYRQSKFGHIKDSYKTIAISKEIQRQLEGEDVFILFGYDWSSEIAYYSERKALSVPEWYLDRFDIDSVDRYFDRPPKLIVICNNADKKYDLFIPRMSKYYLDKELEDCSFFKKRS